MDWLMPWQELAALDWPTERKASYAAAREEQLSREVGPAHALRGRAARLLGMRFDDMDATLFGLEGGAVAEVHLTWRTSEEPDPRWPRTHVFDSLERWAKARMAPEHEIWVLTADPEAQ